jgi:sulfatase modifying factor 1
MITVPGGIFHHGGDGVHVASFVMDRAPVTVGDYRAFATEPTTAERSGGGVFALTTGRFTVREGADFAHPLGDGVAAPEDHPATQLTAIEAEAYCRARGARLPTTGEWEHAARNGRDDRARYPWGDEATDARGAFRANVWQGAFPTANTLADGYLFASPVGSFAPTPLGFVDLVGNVWQWTSSVADERTPSDALPASSEGARIIRGGSFLCDPQVCHGFEIEAEQSADPGSPLMHVGFRCAAN